MSECLLAGTVDFSSTGDGIVSVSINYSTELSKIDDQIIEGPTLGFINLSGYASDKLFTGSVSASATASMQYTRKYDCDNDVIYLILGSVSAAVSGGGGGLASVAEVVKSAVPSANVSVASGPHNLYSNVTSDVGFGINYSGGPISFSASDTVIASINIDSSLISIDKAYLQSFSLSCNHGVIPMANYSFIFSPTDNLKVLGES